ncbi:MAG: class I SAM-dependent methyltransferase [Promethearchaeota archaeon]
MTKENWKLIQASKSVSVEIPEKLAQGKYRSWSIENATYPKFEKFFQIRQPRTVLECGTFEARTTMFFAKLLGRFKPGVLITVDSPLPLESEVPGKIIFKKSDPHFEKVREIKFKRLQWLKNHSEIQIIFFEGLIQDCLELILRSYSFDFVFEDASHVAQVLEKNWRLYNKYCQVGSVICFDDVVENPIWLRFNTRDWIFRFDPELNQLWAERLSA